MTLKEYALNWRNKKRSSHQTLRSSVVFSESRTIGILFHADDDKNIDSVVNLVHLLESEGKKVKILAYASQLLSIGNKLVLSEFTKKDISPLGNIEKEEVKKFIHTDYDFLFCLHNQPFLPFDYVMLRSNAKCRIGRFEEEKTDNYELMIDAPEGISLDDLINQILFYLKEIR